MNSLWWQCVCIALLVLCVVWNRSETGDPKGPLVTIGIVFAVWFLLGIYTIASTLSQGSPHSSSHTGVGVSISSLITLLLACLPIILLVAFLAKARGVPAIHDITTDIQQPPVFTMAKRARHPSHNSLAYDKTNASKQQQAYPDIEPLRLPVTAKRAQAIVDNSINILGWGLHGSRSDDVKKSFEESSVISIEAYDKSTVFGFVDDVVIRITPLDTGSQIDARSASRIGKSDLGANADRIRSLFKNIESQVNVSK